MRLRLTRRQPRSYPDFYLALTYAIMAVTTAAFTVLSSGAQ